MGARFLNVRTNKLIDIIQEGPAYVTVRTVSGSEYGPKRRVAAASLHSHYFTEDGEPHRTGYVPVNTLPGDHPYAIYEEKDEMKIKDIDMIDRLHELDPHELAALVLRQQKAAAEAKELIERAKEIAKSRRTEEGIEIHDGIAMVFTPYRKFDGPTAKRNLKPADFKKILMEKPDATLARKLFENEPDKLEKCLKDYGFSLTVREASDEDYKKADNVSGTNDEDFSL